MTPPFLPTCDIADIFKDDTHSIDSQFRSFGLHNKVCGKIRTIRCFQDNLLIKQTLASAGEGDILIIDGGKSLHTALVGDVIAGSAVKQQWAGIIVYGAIRDSAELAHLPIHIKALGTNPRKSSQIGSGEKDIDLIIDNIAIHPGDWVYSDSDGIVIVTEKQKSQIPHT